MKTKWGILAGFAAIALAVAIGCDTSGGSSINDGPGSTNKPVVVQICFNVPNCSSTAPAAFNGAVFDAGVGYLYLSPSCPSTNDNMYLWIKVVADLDPSAIDHFVWTIRNWTNTAPNGLFDNFDAVLDTNGVFKVRTSLNQIRYVSASASDLLALTSLFNQQIDVTVVAKSGQITSGYISLKLHNGTATGAPLVFGDLQSMDAFSNARVGSYADYFRIMGMGSTNVLSLEGDFDTYLVVYDSNLTGVATNDDILPGLDLNSEITGLLTAGATYFVEATSATNMATGNYSINNSTGALTPVPNPFSGGSQCANIAGTYALSEILIIDLTFQGQSYTFTNFTSSTTEIVQNGCDFAYHVNDPTGLIPPTLRMGRLAFTSIELYNDAIIPQSPDIFITSSTVTGTGLTTAAGVEINSSGSITGTFLGFPFKVNYTSQAAFQ